MIVEAIINLITLLLKTVLGVLPDIPDFPQSLLTSIDNVATTIFGNLNLLGLFVRIDTIKILVPLVIVAVNFEHIYHFAMWLIKKLPISTE